MISKHSAGMTQGAYPSPYIVDTQATRPPLPPRTIRSAQQSKVGHVLLSVLVSLALCCIFVEACFIYRLYQRESQKEEASFSKFVGDNPTPTLVIKEDVLPSKPVAHLTDGQDVVHGKHVMLWSTSAYPLLYEMSYRNGFLIIQKEGYYHVYSKVFFIESGSFQHHVKLNTEKYLGGNITLLQARAYSAKSGEMRSNSYLAGVFHLYKDDALYVSVSDTKDVKRYSPSENVFGAYMI